MRNYDAPTEPRGAKRYTRVIMTAAIGIEIEEKARNSPPIAIAISIVRMKPKLELLPRALLALTRGGLSGYALCKSKFQTHFCKVGAHII